MKVSVHVRRSPKVIQESASGQSGHSGLNRLPPNYVEISQLLSPNSYE